MSSWQDLVTASLLGTERVPVPATAVPGLPPQPGVDLSPDPAAELLDRAALATVARRAGRRPDRAEPLTMAGADPAPTVSPAAGDRLRRILGGENPDLLTEWLTAVVARGRRAPAHLLPALLDRARRGAPADPDLRHLVAQAGGSRAQWLAGLNPDWRFVTTHARTGDETWRLGDPGQRRGFLAGLRAADPSAARDLIAASWATAGPERVMFVSVLADGLSHADEPLLEAALDDRAEDVRSWAAYLLASLPTSALGRRMADRARRFLRLEHGQRGLRLQVIAPAGADAAMRRDGVVPGPWVAAGLAPGGSHLADQAGVVLEVVSRTPLDTWTGEFGLPPGQIVALPSGDWAPVLFAGWSRAATAQGRYDPGARAWMAGLFTAALRPMAPASTTLTPTALAGYRPPATAAQTAALRQLARRADPELGAPGQLPDAEPGAAPAVHGAIGVLRFRYEMLKELDG
jgi:hypothetical protein